MDDEPEYSIGELARRTGLTVKAVRFYSDHGIVPPSGRTASGHRRYGVEVLARLDLVRTLRDLGLDLATIRKVIDRDTALSDVAAVHAEALRVQMRVLCLRRAVLTAVAKRGSTPEEASLMHKLAKLTVDERDRLTQDFLDGIFHGLDHPAFPGIARSMTPELPDNPEIEQVEAWVELAELCQDPEFRALMRRMAEQYAAGPGPWKDIHAALTSGVDPRSRQAAELVAALTSLHGPERLAAWLDAVGDPRRERYLRLLAVINGWAAPDSPAPASRWLSDALGR